MTPYDPNDLIAKIDTPIVRAEHYLKNGFPEGVVPWNTDTPSTAK